MRTISSAWRASVPGSWARVSTRSAQADGPSVASTGGMPGFVSTERSEGRSMISAAATGPPLRRWVAIAACSMSGKSMSALARCACSSTVRKVTSATKASVPSEPTIRWARISKGSWKSTSELSP